MARNIGVLLVLLMAGGSAAERESCLCDNGGKCQASNLASSCHCPAEYIGKYCETRGELLQERAEYVWADHNFTYYIFAPELPNLYRLSFETCMLHNPQDLETQVFITTDQDNGSPAYEPSILTSAKIKVKEGTCLTFSSPYLEIKHNLERPFWRVIIGVRVMQKAYRNVFYRSVPGKNQREIPQEVVDAQPAATA